MRSPRGQFTLLAAAYAGAMLLAVVALGMRSLVFERWFLREKFPRPTQKLHESLAQASGNPREIERAADLPADDFHIAYGLWINGELDDPRFELARAWSRKRPKDLFTRVRGTCLVGSPKQRRRALDALRLIDDETLSLEKSRLIRYLDSRARVRGDLELREAIERTAGQ